MNNYDDPGIALTPLGKRVAVALLILGIVIALALVLVRSADAAPLDGNRGGCAEANRWRMIPCTVTDFRPGRVSGTCAGGLWFKDAPTRRVFRLEQAITVQGCEYMNWQLASAPGWPLRISR